VHAVGVHAVGVHAVGVHAVGVHAVGVHAVGVHAVGVHAVGVHIFRSGLFRYRYMFQYTNMQYITGTLPNCGTSGTFGMFFVSPKLIHSRCPMYHCIDSFSGTSDRTSKSCCCFARAVCVLLVPA
jgi:hypothetical protein